VLFIAQRSESGIGLTTDGLPDPLLPSEEAQVGDALGMILLLAIDNRIPGAEASVLVEDGIIVAIPAVGSTDADVQRILVTFTRACGE